MNAQERDQLTQFLKPLTEARLQHKDSDAENLILDAAKRQPDALYLLVQRAMLLEQALNGAKAQINDLQSQLQAAQNAGGRSGFLSHDPWAQPASNNGPVPGMGRYAEPRYAPPQQNTSFLGGGGGSSFLGNIATTAAGVVAGSFLFQGIENLLGHHSPSSWMDQASHTPETVSETTTINNFWGDQSPESAMQEANVEDSFMQEASYTDDSANDDTDTDYQDDGDSDWI